MAKPKKRVKGHCELCEYVIDHLGDDVQQQQTRELVGKLKVLLHLYDPGIGVAALMVALPNVILESDFTPCEAKHVLECLGSILPSSIRLIGE